MQKFRNGDSWIMAVAPDYSWTSQVFEASRAGHYQVRGLLKHPLLAEVATSVAGRGLDIKDPTIGPHVFYVCNDSMDPPTSPSGVLMM